ncbi:hypothetical protein Esti_000363 [Eimeria stiedai]
MLQSLWKSISSWGDLPANFPYTLGSAVPYGFELPGGFVQFYGTRSKPSGGSEAVADACRKQPILDSLINPSKGSPVSVFAFKRDKQQGPIVNASSPRSPRDFTHAKNHLVKSKTLLHPNLLKVIATYETSSALYVVTECCFSLVHVLYLSQQQQQQQQLAAKRPSALPPPASTSDDSKATVDGKPPEVASYAAAAAAAAEAAAAASSSCWNLLELIGALSFLNDQCNLAHGEVSPFSVFVTPHGKWKLSCFSLSRPLDAVRWPDFYSEVVTSISAAQGWAPPRPPSGARPDTLDRWGLCSVFAWWLDSRRDPYSAVRFARGGGPSEGSLGGAPRGFSIGLDDEALRQALLRLPSPLQQLLQQILSARASCVPLSKLTAGEGPCFAGKSILTPQHTAELPCLALLFMNSGVSAYHCSLLKSILSLVVPPAPSASSKQRMKAQNTNSLIALRLLAEVLARAFDCSDRAIRFALLTQLPSVQEMLPDGFFSATWDSLVLGLEDSAPAIRGSTARCLALYASRLPPDSPSASSIFPLLEQRLRDVVGGVRLQAVAAAAAAAKEQQQQQQQQHGTREIRRGSQSLVQILSAAVRDPEDTVKIAGLQACAYCADTLPLPGVVSLLALAASCYLSPSRDVATSTSGAIHALAETARSCVEEQHRRPNEHASETEGLNVRYIQSKPPPEGWLTTVKSLSSAIGLGKRSSDSSAFLARRGSASLGTSASGGPPSAQGTPSRKGRVPPPGQQQQAPPPPSRPSHNPPARDSMSPLSRSLRVEVRFAADDCEDIPADAWEATADFEAPVSAGSSTDCMQQQQQQRRPPLHIGSVGKVAFDATSQKQGPRKSSAEGPLGPPSIGEVRGQALNYQQSQGGGLTPGMRLEAADTGPRLSLLSSAVGAAGLSPLATNGIGAKQHAPAAAALDASTDDFFAALEREAAERNL